MKSWWHQFMSGYHAGLHNHSASFTTADLLIIIAIVLLIAWGVRKTRRKG